MGINGMDNTPMQRAWEEAKKARARGEVPVGAVLVHAKTGEIVACASNKCEERHDPTAHAEILAIQELSSKVSQQRLAEYDLYVTLEGAFLRKAHAIIHPKYMEALWRKNAVKLSLISLGIYVKNQTNSVIFLYNSFLVNS